MKMSIHSEFKLYDMKKYSVIIILLLSFLLIPGQINSSGLKQIARITKQGDPVFAKSIVIKDGNVLVLGIYSTGVDFLYGGILAKINGEGNTEWIKFFDEGNKPVNPKYFFINSDNDITVFSETSLEINEYFIAGQRLNVRKFTQSGNEIYNYTDTNVTQNTVSDIFTAGLDRNNNPLAVFSPLYYKDETKTVINNYDSNGKLLEIHKIDSSRAIDPGQGIYEKYQVKGFRIAADSSIYCFGERYITGLDTISSYVMKVNTDYQIEWKILLYGPSQLVYTLYDLIILDNGNMLCTGYNAGNGFIAEISPEKGILWQHIWDDQAFTVHPYKVIINSSGDLIIAGDIKDRSTSDQYDNYIARLSPSGEILWENSSGSTNDKETLKEIVEYEKNNYYALGNNNNALILYRFKDDIMDVADPVSIGDDKLLYPCPAGDFVIIKNIGDINKSKVEIFTVEGIKIFESDYQEKINISDFTPGLYLVKIGTDFRKLIKK